MKKKYKIQGINAIVILCIAIIIFVLGLLFVYEMLNDFNPETDVCDEQCPHGFVECKHIKYGESRNGCLRWHKASKCELNPNAEGCVCDEYEQVKKINQLYVDECCFRFDLNILGNTTINLDDRKYRGNLVCVNADSNYYIINSLCNDSNNMFYEEKGECIKAHEPTIHDLTCEELKEGFMYPCGRNSICLSTTAGDKEKEYLLEILERC